MLDENDESPMFSQTTYSASVPENSRGGVFVVSAQASEKQKGITYIYTYTYTVSPGVGEGDD